MEQDQESNAPKVSRPRRRLYQAAAAENSATAAPVPPAAAPERETSREKDAMEIFKRHAPFIAGVALVPLPFVDGAWVAGVQLKMLKEISAVYGVPFSRNLGKTATGVLLGGHASFSLAKLASALFLRPIPVVGVVARAASSALFGMAASYALCRVFIMHYESGGTLLTFDPAKMKGHFAAALKEGEHLAAGGLF